MSKLQINCILGWYRHCGIVPWTTDMDLAMWIDEYDDEILQKFIGNQKLFIWEKLGMKKMGLEFRMYGCDWTYDMFFMYKKETSNEMCIYYHGDNMYPLVSSIFFNIYNFMQ